MTAGAQRRRRRSAEEAEREILGAAEAFLRARPFRDLTIDEVMDGTGLSRPSFYVYFRDRHHLALKLIDEIAREVFATAGAWLEGDDPSDLYGALHGTAAVFAEHGPMMRAIAHAATEAADVEHAYRRLVDGFVDVTATRISRDVAAGRSTVADAHRTAAALCWMNERTFIERLGREPVDDPQRLAEALYGIWRSAIYG